MDKITGGVFIAYLIFAILWIGFLVWAGITLVSAIAGYLNTH